MSHPSPPQSTSEKPALACTQNHHHHHQQQQQQQTRKPSAREQPTPPHWYEKDKDLDDYVVIDDFVVIDQPTERDQHREDTTGFSYEVRAFNCMVLALDVHWHRHEQMDCPNAQARRKS